MKVRLAETTPKPVDRTFHLEMDLTSRELAVLMDAARNHSRGYPNVIAERVYDSLRETFDLLASA